MAQPDVTAPMREFIQRNGDFPIDNARFIHNSKGELVTEECRGTKALYVKTNASGDWTEHVLPFKRGAAAPDPKPAPAARAYTLVDLRDTYGAIPYPTRPLSAVTAYRVHHSAGRAAVSVADAKALIQEIHLFHQHTRGWPGFAYNEAIWEDHVFTVRPITRMGWHSAGADYNGNGIGDANENGYAVVLLGNYEHQPPNARTLATLEARYRDVCADLGRPLALRGHRDDWGTTCPGNWWPAWKVGKQR